jgi:hypothetical protein
MTGEESRKLKSGDRVFWRGDLKNQGTIKGTSWSGSRLIGMTASRPPSVTTTWRRSVARLPERLATNGQEADP